MNHLSSAHSHGLHNATQAPVIQPTPVIYYPLNGDILNYATGTGVSDTTGTGNFVSSHPSGTGNSQLMSTNTYCLQRNIPITIPTDVGNGFTVAFWYNTNSAISTTHSFCWLGLGQTSGTNTNSTYVTIGGSSATCYLKTSGLGGFNAANFYTTAWQHYAFVFTKLDSSNNFNVKVYRNGGFSYTLNSMLNYNTCFAGNSNVQTIGKALDNAIYYNLTGYMSNYRIYTQVLTPDQITYLYTNKL